MLKLYPSKVGGVVLSTYISVSDLHDIKDIIPTDSTPLPKVSVFKPELIKACALIVVTELGITSSVSSVVCANEL